MTYTEKDIKLIEEFQNFAGSILWSNDDGSEKYIGVGNMADWWIEKIHQAIAEERERVRGECCIACKEMLSLKNEYK